MLGLSVTMKTSSILQGDMSESVRPYPSQALGFITGSLGEIAILGFLLRASWADHSTQHQNFNTGSEDSYLLGEKMQREGNCREGKSINGGNNSKLKGPQEGRMNQDRAIIL